MFRRDLRGALHISTLSFSLTDHRRHIALQLLIARRQLREKRLSERISRELYSSKTNAARRREITAVLERLEKQGQS